MKAYELKFAIKQSKHRIRAGVFNQKIYSLDRRRHEKLCRAKSQLKSGIVPTLDSKQISAPNIDYEFSLIILREREWVLHVYVRLASFPLGGACHPNLQRLLCVSSSAANIHTKTLLLTFSMGTHGHHLRLEDQYSRYPPRATSYAYRNS